MQLVANPYLSWIAPLLGIGFIWLVGKPGSILYRIPGWIYLPLLAIIFLITRLYWLASVPTVPTSDFAAYDMLANHLRTGRPFQVQWPYLSYAWGYPLLLGVWYNLAGSSLAAAKALNMIIGLGSLTLVYLLARQVSEAAGRLAALFFALWPAQMAMTSVLASEHLALLLLLAAMVFLFKSFKGPPGAPYFLALAGALLAAGYLTRGVSVVAVIAAFLTLLALPENIKTRLLRLACLAAGFGLIYLVYSGGMNLVYRMAPTSQGYSTFLTGANFQSQGGWNTEDGLKYISFPTSQEANQYARDEFIRRATSRPAAFVQLMFVKVLRTWGDETYGAAFSMDSLAAGTPKAKLASLRRAVELASQYAHLFWLLLALVAGWKMLMKGWLPPRPEILLLLLLILGTASLHSIVEAQARYHYLAEPALMVLAALGCLTLGQK